MRFELISNSARVQTEVSELSYSTNRQLTERLIFEGRVPNEAITFEINDDYVYCSDRKMGVYALKEGGGYSRERLSLIVCVKVCPSDAKWVRERIAEQGHKNNQAVGFLKFMEPITTQFEGSSNAALMANIYVSDDEFKLFKSMSQNPGFELALALNTENRSNSNNPTQPNLQWGWEPDASRAEWKITKEKGSDFIGIQEFCVTQIRRQDNESITDAPANTTEPLLRVLSELKDRLTAPQKNNTGIVIVAALVGWGLAQLLFK